MSTNIINHTIYRSDNFVVIVRDDEFNRISIDSIGRLVSIHVDCHHLDGGTDLKINWCATGSNTVDETRRFAAVLDEAIRLVGRLEADVLPRLDKGVAAGIPSIEL